MKNLNFPISFLVAVSFVIFSCSKDNDNEPSESTMTKKEILTSHTWQVQETYQVVTGKLTHYVRGGENTTGVDIGAMRVKFNPDGTGTNTDISGTTYNMTWNFTTPDESGLRLLVNGTVEYIWVLNHYEKDKILTTSPVSTNGLITSKLIPAP